MIDIDWTICYGAVERTKKRDVEGYENNGSGRKEGENTTATTLKHIAFGSHINAEQTLRGTRNDRKSCHCTCHVPERIPVEGETER